MQHGALVISLDFELHWGVRDLESAASPYVRNILGARSVIPQMLRLFEEYEVAATWATVGFLFASNRDELIGSFPGLRPQYTNPKYNPYAEPVGKSEADDPLHYGASLVKAISETPGQEIASHTLSHYFCCEEGQDAAAFRADLECAQRIAQERIGHKLFSLVFPRNQVRQDYLPTVRDSGFRCYRGTQRGWLHEAEAYTGTPTVKRALRLADAYLPITNVSDVAWGAVAESNDGLHNLPASRFFRPFNSSLAWFNQARIARVASEMRHASKSGRLYHLWWHPHNFGAHPEESLAGLRKVLQEFRVLRDQTGFRSLSMQQATEVALESEAV